jgi:hypothetical protein
MERTSNLGRSMQSPIEKSDFTKHVQRLRQVFDRRVEAKHGDVFQLATIQNREGMYNVTLQRNSSTIDAISDLDREEVCAVLVSSSKKSVLCAYFESWEAASRNRLLFQNASLTFYLHFGAENSPETKQIFRLEWENWHNQNPPNTAAYPHWQFDRWLTASDSGVLEDLRESLEGPQSNEIIFETAEKQVEQKRPDLGWFTRIHFPSIAPWATNPITAIDVGDQSQRSLPSSPKQIEDWLDSALCYLKSELSQSRVSSGLF